MSDNRAAIIPSSSTVGSADFSKNEAGSRPAVSPTTNMISKLRDAFRTFGPFDGTLFLIGALIMIYNLWRTATSGVVADKPARLAPAAA